NPRTHGFTGTDRSVAEVGDVILSAHHERPLDGVTFSGGEPMQQAEDLLALIEWLRERLHGLSFGMYSGYSVRELARGRYWCQSDRRKREKQHIGERIKSHLVFAVVGRYVADRPSVLPLRSSANKKLMLFSRRYCEEDFGVPEVEVEIDAEGAVQ